MPLGEHLKEFRRRFLLAAVGILAATVAGWFLYDLVFPALKAPFDALDDQGRTADLNFPALASSLDTRMRVSIFIGFLLASPWWIYQVWAFITPALTRSERRVALGVTAAAVPLFGAGVYTSWQVIPRAVQFLTMFTPEGTWNLVAADTYLKFVMQFLLAFGIAYLMPLFMVVLSAMGIVSGRTWLKGWRWAVILIFLFCAAVTPTVGDLTSMFLMAVPMVVLYIIAVGLGLLADRHIARRRAAVDAELAGGSSPERA